MIHLRQRVDRVPLTVLDDVAVRLTVSAVSEAEADLLGEDLWLRGEDVRLREDSRFELTPWGRWVVAGRVLVNDRLFSSLTETLGQSVTLAEAMGGTPDGVFCSGDPRFRFAHGMIRVPKPGDEPGRRDLTSDEGRASVREQLRTALHIVFATPVVSEEPGGASLKPPPEARLVCMGADEGGLHIETAPLTDLPTFVKRLRVMGAEGETSVVASNMRTHTWLTRVPPSAGPYRWAAPGFEEDLEGRLSRLTVEGPPVDQPSVFRVDAAGVGRLISGNSLTPGRPYRVLIPPAFPALPIGTTSVSKFAGGWRLWEMTASDATDTDSVGLNLCGLELNLTSARLKWVVVGPSGYFPASSGEAIPMFTVGEDLTLSVAAPRTSESGELVLFVLVGDELRSLPLPPGQEWFIGLGDLPVGHHGVKLLHMSTQVPPEWEPFVIGSSPLGPPPARLAATLQGHQPLDGGDGCCRFVGDFSEITAGSDNLEVVTPPCWTVRVVWDDGRRLHLNPAYGEVDGTVDLTQIIARTADVRRLALEGDLSLDCGELGRVLLRHSRTRDPVLAVTRLRDLQSRWASTLAGLGDQFPLIRTTWLNPILDVLGYETRDLAPEDLLVLPAGVTAFLLMKPVRQDGRVIRMTSAILLMAAVDSDFSAGSLTALRVRADEICLRHDCEFAILTEGIHWARHRRGYSAPARVWDLREVTQLGAEHQFADYYETFGG